MSILLLFLSSRQIGTSIYFVLTNQDHSKLVDLHARAIILDADVDAAPEAVDDLAWEPLGELPASS